MRGLLLDVNNNKVEVIQSEKDFELEEYYRFLDCDTIDIVRRKIGSRYYDIVCDDEGLLKSGYKVSAVDRNMNGMLVGNLFIRGQARDGEMTNLRPLDIDYIMERIVFVQTEQCPDGYWVLTDCEY